MRFNVWFKQWIASFLKLLTVGSKRRKSDAQRRKDRARRLKAKFSGATTYRLKKKYSKRRSSHHVENERLIGATFKFIAISLGILLLPFGLFDWGHKNVKAKRISRAKKKSAPRSDAVKAAPPTIKESRSGRMASARSTISAAETKCSTAKPSHHAYTQASLFDQAEAAPFVAVPTTAPQPDEHTPKSIPKNQKDRYIHKRMLIAGTYYCDPEVLKCLKVGSRFELAAEPDNPNDKDAVKLLYCGKKIGYIAKQERLAFATYLKLNQSIYGIITDIKERDDRTQYEFEAWFDSSK